VSASNSLETGRLCLNVFQSQSIEWRQKWSTVYSLHWQAKTQFQKFIGWYQLELWPDNEFRSRWFNESQKCWMEGLWIYSTSKLATEHYNNFKKNYSTDQKEFTATLFNGNLNKMNALLMYIWREMLLLLSILNKTWFECLIHCSYYTLCTYVAYLQHTLCCIW